MILEIKWNMHSFVKCEPFRNSIILMEMGPNCADSIPALHIGMQPTANQLCNLERLKTTQFNSFFVCVKYPYQNIT